MHSADGGLLGTVSSGSGLGPSGWGRQRRLDDTLMQVWNHKINKCFKCDQSKVVEKKNQVWPSFPFNKGFKS